MPYADPIKEAEYQRAYRERNKPRLREQNRAWRAANADELKVKKHQEYLRTMDACKARAKRHREANKQKIRAVRSTPEYRARRNALRRAQYASSAELREAALRQCREYRQEHRGEISQKKKLARALETLWHRRYRHALSKAAMKGAVIGNKEELKAFYESAYSGEVKHCEYCKSSVELANIRVNHKDPFILGGRHEVSNLAIACIDCNRVKLGMPLKQWLELLSKGRETEVSSRPLVPLPFHIPAGSA